MPRYFFHLHDDIISVDEEGVELPDTAAARARAVECAREIASAQVLCGKLSLKHRIEVGDENGDRLFTIVFADVIDVET